MLTLNPPTKASFPRITSPRRGEPPKEDSISMTVDISSLIRIGRKLRDTSNNEIIDDLLPSGRECGICCDRLHLD